MTKTNEIINKKDVLLLHHFGLIDDPKIAESVEQWIAVDPVAQEFLDRLDPDYQEPSSELQSSIDSIVREVELYRIWNLIVCKNRGSLDQSNQVVLSANLEGTPFDRVETSLEVAMAAAPDDPTQMARRVHSERDRLIVDLGERTVRIKYPTADIPFGLAWIYYTSPSQHLSRALIELAWDEYNGQTNWIGSIAISALTDDKSEALSWFSVFPVTEEQRADPSVLTELNGFVSRLSASPQRTKAEAFLNSETADGDTDE
jgi:hypothetical protein